MTTVFNSTTSLPQKYRSMFRSHNTSLWFYLLSYPVLPRLTAALSFFAIRSFYALIITYGVLFGFGIGIAYSPAMTLAMKVSQCSLSFNIPFYFLLEWLNLPFLNLCA